MERTVHLETFNRRIDVCLGLKKLSLGPELRIIYPLILNFFVSDELELNGIAHPKCMMPKGVLTFENSDANLVATQACFFGFNCRYNVAILFSVFTIGICHYLIFSDIYET